jgi:carboxypeptidase Q
MAEIMIAANANTTIGGSDDSDRVGVSGSDGDGNSDKVRVGDSTLRDILAAAEGATSRAYDALEALCICYPGRVSGSDGLEHALNYLFEYGSRCLPAECCQQETVFCVPCWVRGDWRQETCRIRIIPGEQAWPIPFPLEREIRVLANGLSVGTNSEGVSGVVVVVRSFDELKVVGSNGGLVGKIVLYDYKHYVDYGSVAAFRRSGAVEAAKYGAVAALIRTLAPDSSIGGAHTGTQAPHPVGPVKLDDDSEAVITPIPAACVAIEDVELISRLIQRENKISATLTLPCKQLADRQSRNIIFELKGSEFPDEIVIIGGHTDSWDCQKLGCQGAHDDGQGVILSMEIIRVLYEGGWRPRRTIRAVLFVDEEVLQSGANAYADGHQQECLDKRIVAAIETDLGVGPVCGFGFSGTEKGREQLREMLRPLSSILGLPVSAVDDRWSGHGVDISPLIDRFGVPGLLLRHEDTWWNDDYFHIHHSTADTIDHVNIDLMKLNFQVLIGCVWILANSDNVLHRS